MHLTHFISAAGIRILFSSPWNSRRRGACDGREARGISSWKHTIGSGRVMTMSKKTCLHVNVSGMKPNRAGVCHWQYHTLCMSLQLRTKSKMKLPKMQLAVYEATSPLLSSLKLLCCAVPCCAELHPAWPHVGIVAACPPGEYRATIALESSHPLCDCCWLRLE